MNANGSSGEFEIDINFGKLKNDSPIIKILKDTKNRFVVKIDKCLEDSNSVIYTIYNDKLDEELGNNKHVARSVGLKHIYKDSECKKHCKVLTLNNLTSDAVSLKVNLLMLTEQNDFNDTVKVRINPAGDFGPKLDDFLDQLECPVCNDTLRAPIFMCNGGHSICTDCRSRLSHCPLCRKIMKNIRNYALESISEKFKHQCNSCGEWVAGDQISSHELNCFETVKGHTLFVGGISLVYDSAF